ncbi:Conserved_hypothetical protein [Hexamita inflata]|uniref:Uncharacterized protein n=1 Tax=Hexamita inflata TaxID=28002 RepID=A0AA86RST7_9EUKA|nr:Conserved hypothetical protein [Hexamita inflata]
MKSQLICQNSVRVPQYKLAESNQCQNYITGAIVMHLFCSKRETINNLIVNQNNIFSLDQQYSASQHHSIFHDTYKVQNLIVSSQISNNQASSISTSFSTFGHQNDISLTQISLNLELTSAYSRASFLSLTLQNLKVIQSAFNFTGTSENISSLVDVLDSKAIINQVKLNINLAGKYASGLVMTLKPEATMTISNLKMFGVITADVLAALISMSQSSSADIQGTICVQILGSSCSSCLQFSMATCCPFDSKIVKMNDYYTCSCNDSTKTLLDQLALGSTSCVCRESYFTSYSSCAQCPADSTSAKNSASCSCSYQFQAHNTVSNSCDCTPSYSSKINGICSCCPGASIQGNTCQCTLGATRGGDACVCTAGATLIKDVCVCPTGAVLTAQGTCQCPEFSTLVSSGGVYSCQCMAGGSISGTSCVCTTGATLLYGQCVCPSGATLTGNVCVCPTNGNLVLSGGSYICQCNSNMVLSGSFCICIQNSYPYDNYCLCPTYATVQNNICTCPTGATISGTYCICPTGAQMTQDQCICPTGAVISGNSCQCPTYSTLVNNVGVYSCMCGANMVLSGSSCVCIPNGYLSGSSCLCPASSTLTNMVTCVCPTGSYASGSSCLCYAGATMISNQCVCTAGATMNASGYCICPKGATLDANRNCACTEVKDSVWKDNKCKCDTDYSSITQLSIGQYYCQNLNKCCSKILKISDDNYYKCSDDSKNDDCTQFDYVT